jgi:hypothetical protein
VGPEERAYVPLERREKAEPDLLEPPAKPIEGD